VKLIKKNSLKDTIIGYGLIPLETIKYEFVNKVYIGIGVEEFLEFAVKSKFEYIYYYYTYYSIEDYIIPYELYSEYSKEFRKEVQLYNNAIKAFDFETPKSLTLFSIQSGTFVGIILKDLWLEDDGYSEATYAMDEFEDKFHHEVKVRTAIDREKQRKDEEELIQIIFNDPKFAYNCKNQDLRYHYLIDLLERDGMSKYQYLVEPFGIAVSGNAKMFMDRVWQSYKEQKKNK